MAPTDPVELRADIAKRASIKGQVTRFRTLVEQQEHSGDVAGFDLRLQRFRELWDSFLTVQEHIEILNDGESQPDERNAFEDAYITLLQRAESLVPNSRANSAAAPTVSPFTTHSGSSTVQLPKLKLPDFHGNYDEWLGFSDSFESLVHDNADIAPVQKLHFLRGCLKGEAAKIVQSFDTSAISYDAAWASLKERYDNKRVIVLTHTWGLQELPAATESSVSSLRTLYDTALRHVRALRALGEPVDSWGTMLVQLVSSKLDRTTFLDWERTLEGTSVPKIEDLWKFLNSRCSSLESTRVDVSATDVPASRKNSRSQTQTRERTLRANVATQPNVQCPVCKENHSIQSCKTFLELDHKRRSETVKRSGICFNCFRSGHRISACRSNGCRVCGREHHTLLHIGSNAESDGADAQSSGRQGENPATVLQISVPNQVLLSTAIVDILDERGEPHRCRVMLDSGAQVNAITEELASKLRLKRDDMDLPVSGFGERLTRIKHAVGTTVKSRDGRFARKLSFVVSPSVAGFAPPSTIIRNTLGIPKNVVLADPQFHKPARIDALIGGEIFYTLMHAAQIPLNEPDTVLQKTPFGWIVAGRVPETAPSTLHCNTATLSLDASLQRFWEIEDYAPVKHLSAQERSCEEHFLKTYSRDKTGRYCVRLPFNKRLSDLGDSFDIAQNRLLSLERRLARDSNLRKDYTTFLHQYRELGHMTDVTESHESSKGYYIPHHAVLKQDSSTTKVRVVFDASAKSSSGISLNDVLMIGPTLQQDIFCIMTRFRSHAFVLTADIEKMYRQILVHADDARYQRILWRESPKQRIRVYQLNTVTYGTASASFLATRALTRLAEEEANSFPLGASILKRDFYVDDLITGANTLNDAVNIRDQLIKLLARGGFHIRQWASNDRRLIQPLAERSSDVHICLDKDATSRKTLGINWLPLEDKISYRVLEKKKANCTDTRVTKRAILSRIASLFDPIGILAPIIVTAKILLQQLWLAKIGWDESVPLVIATAWREYKHQLVDMKEIRVLRTIVAPKYAELQMHGYCDASEKAYGACVYARSRSIDGIVTVRLICSKTRVAPLKKLSLPRLELCAAVLLSKLVHVAKTALELH